MPNVEELAEIIEKELEDGFWKSSTKKLFGEKAAALIAHGFTQEEAVALLMDLYSACGSEYGN